MRERLPLALLALPALALARLLPAEGAGLYLRLAAATAALLLPGLLVARALGQRGGSAAFVWTLALVFAGLVAAFALGSSLLVTLAVVALGGAAALPLALRRTREPLDRGRAAALALGALFGIALWRVAGNLTGGDALFHLARTRKLASFDELSLHAVGEFADGGLHPGYAFPLWHGFLGLLSQLAGVDPALVVQHGSSVLAPLAFLVVFEAGAALFASAWAGGAVVAAQVALISLAPGHGGAYVALALPATSSRQLIVPAILALLFSSLRAAAPAETTRGDRAQHDLPPDHPAGREDPDCEQERGKPSNRLLLGLSLPALAALGGVAAGGLALTLVHPSYSPFLALPVAGFLAARALFDLPDAGRIGLGLGALLVPSGLAILWLLPVVRETRSHAPDAGELERALEHYATQVEVLAEGSYRLAPAVLGRSGAVAVAALALIPLAALAGRRRWAAWVLGGSLAVLAAVLVPELFVRVSDAFSLSQSRRLAGFVPFAFALAGGLAVLARLLGPLVVPLALAAGVALQLAYPGDFTARLDEGGGPAALAWLALAGGAVALAAAALVRRDLVGDRRDAYLAAAAVAFVLPVAVSAARTWEPTERRQQQARLTEGLVTALREQVPERAVVFSDLETSYRVGAFAPVYVAANPPAHVADTEANRPYDRRLDVIAFFRDGDLEIPRRYDADYLVVDRSRFDLELDLPVVHEDERFSLLRLEP